MIGLFAAAVAQDLVVDGVDVELVGAEAYDRVIVRNGGRLLVSDTGNGTLTLTAALVRVEQGSEIRAVGSGHRGEVDLDGGGPGGGGAGIVAGAGGSAGGAGTSGWTESCAPDGLAVAAPGDEGRGSAGGGANGEPGGDGGGVIEIVADRIEIFGTIDASGESGAGGAGGGAGGRITLRGDVVRCSGALVARGGDGGGGGGGGAVTLVSDSEGPTCPVDVSGGRSSCACGGAEGQVLRSTADYDLDGVLAVDGDCRASDPAVHPGASEGSCDGADNDCDGLYDEGAASCGGCERVEAGPGTSWLYCDTPTTRDLADAACAAAGAYTLVTVGDAAENALVAAEVEARSATPTDWLIGFEDQAVEGQWGWASGLPVTYANWGQVVGTQPNDDDNPFPDANCASIGYEGPGWRDLSCDRASPFVCEVCPERTWYDDDDGDGWGDALDVQTGCAEIAGRAERAGDCDDSDDEVHPGAYETCNGVDDNCDGVLDDADGPVAWFADVDSDDAGDPEALVLATCALAPAGAVARAGDCDDGDNDLEPGETELCDGVDQDCDGEIDEDGACLECVRDRSADGRSTWLLCPDDASWADAAVECDARGYGFAVIDDAGENERLANLARAEEEDVWFGLSDLLAEGSWFWTDGSPVTYTHWEQYQPDDGEVSGNQECARFWVDESCFWDDALCTSRRPYLCEVHCAEVARHADLDGDGYGAGPQVLVCEGAEGYAANALDCDDLRQAVHPAAPEVPADEVDQDCDGLDRCWEDADGDGFGGAPTAGTCTSAGLAARGGDCDDLDDSRYPGAPEVGGDGLDQDCDCGDLCYADDDGDGFGGAPVPVGGPSCAGLDGLVAVGGDCDDQDPERAELCDEPTTGPTGTGDDDDDLPGATDASLSSEDGLSGYFGCGCRVGAGGGLAPALLVLLSFRRGRRSRSRPPGRPGRS